MTTIQKAIKTTSHLFHSNAKLLLTGEYMVLAGARAVALPLIKGQSMEVEYIPDSTVRIIWRASDPDGLWFEAELIFAPKLTFRTTGDPIIARKLIGILNAARSLNPTFLTAKGTYSVNNQMTFKREWGWGSSSTLISNIARWAGIDPFELNRLVSDGSGYDIACARSDTPLFYKLQNGFPLIVQIRFSPVFHEHLVFVYLGKKQDTSLEIKRFQPDGKTLEMFVDEISAISDHLVKADNLIDFNRLINKHEAILGNVLDRPTIKERIFPDFEGSVKSLGAWGGDFILASAAGNQESILRYFNDKGYPVTFPWKEIIR